MNVLVLFAAVAIAAAILLLVPTVVFTLEVLAALLPRAPSSSDGAPSSARPSVAVLMPAHDEEDGIAAAVATVVPQLETGDRVLVVADNCSDATARLAAAAGAEVVERHDARRRGKGYALDFGMQQLALDPPQVLIVVDADCTVGPGALATLAQRAHERRRPVQALYLMFAPPGAGLKMRIAEFAWAVKNRTRPLGLNRLGLACQLMGTGMAIPWALLREGSLASGHLVEDMELGLRLAAAGAAPLFCPEARVESLFPTGTEAVTSQRTRWEQGHMSMIASSVLRLGWQAIRRRRLELGVLALDLAVPPLALLALLWVGCCGLALGVAAVGGSAWPLGVAAGGTALFGTGVLMAWWQHGRGSVSLKELLSVPAYVVVKIPIYFNFLRKRQVEWVRTKRDERGR